MKIRLLVVLSIIVSISLYQCNSIKKIDAPTEDVLVTAKQLYPNISLDDLTKGHSLLTTSCTRCHGLNPVTKYTTDEWQKIISAMAPKAKLDDTQKTLLTQYILSSREHLLKK
jgi:cytochrome c5